MPPQLKAAVVITTRNRKDDLRRAIRSAFRQSVQPAVLVVDDGSTDGTAEMVRAEFPRARLIPHDDSRGYIVRRNEGASLVKGDADIIVSIDDDAEFSTPTVIERTLPEFDSPRVGAVAMPYVDVRKDTVVRQIAPGSNQTWITDSFIGTAHALRLDLFLALNGYRSQLIHQGEERDYCIRMLQAGLLVRLGNADTIHHFESPKRDMSRMDYYGRRNDVLFAWHNVPWPYFPIHLLATLANGFSSALRVKRYRRMFQGMAAGCAGCLHLWKERLPVSAEVYRLHRTLRKCGPQLLSEVEPQMPRRAFL